MQIVIGIGAKPTVSPFERVGLNSSVGGIQVTTDNKFSCLFRFDPCID